MKENESIQITAELDSEPSSPFSDQSYASALVGFDALSKLRSLAPKNTLMVLRPRMPIEKGEFNIQHANVDKESLIKALNPEANRRLVYIDFDGTSQVKFLSGAQIARKPNAIQKAIIVVPDNLVENMKALFERSSFNAEHSKIHSIINR